MQFDHWLQRYIEGVLKHPLQTLAAIMLLAVVCTWYTATHFQLNSNLSDLIDQSADWREDFDSFRAQYPDLVDTAVVVVSGESVAGVERVTGALVDRFRADSEWFALVSAPAQSAFLRDRALYFLDEAQLDEMAVRLAEAQPVLTAVAEDESLRGVLRLFSQALTEDTPEGFDTLITLVTQSAEAVINGDDPTVYWTDEFFATTEVQHRLIFLKGLERFNEALPNAAVLSRIREHVAGVNLPEAISVHVTGEVALEHEEMEAALAGVKIAGWLALALLLAVLIIGVRSVKIIVALFLMLGIGIAWTMAFALVTVGEFNTLSIVFLVMFFGLGVDFALHFSLRYQEAINNGSRIDVALRNATGSVGRAIALCTVTTAIAFLAFVPTAYRGLAELGLISAGGMVIAMVLTFTFLPSFYQIAGRIRPHVVDLPTGDRLVHFLIRHRPAVLVTLLLMSIASIWAAGKAHFDYSVLALKDQSAESVRTLRMLQADGEATDYALFVVSDSPLDTTALLALPEVGSVTTIADVVPEDQEEKRWLLDDIQLLLGSALVPARRQQAATSTEIDAMVDALTQEIEANATVLAEPRWQRLHTALTRLQEQPVQALMLWQSGVLGNLQDELAWLRRALAADVFTVEDLPSELSSRFISADGNYLSIVLPAEDLTDVGNLNTFITAVRELQPTATGRPVIEWGTGAIVVQAFATAMVLSLLGIVAILWLTFRRLDYTALIMLPLVLAAVGTLAAGVWLNSPLNMANVLVLPLIFGLGVDNGIHVVDRYLRAGDVDHLLHSSTPRAVMMSTLTTIGTFAALMLSPHGGTASIGVLLTIAVGLILILTVFLLPVFLARNPA